MVHTPTNPPADWVTYITALNHLLWELWFHAAPFVAKFVHAHKGVTGGCHTLYSETYNQARTIEHFTTRYVCSVTKTVHFKHPVPGPQV